MFSNSNLRFFFIVFFLVGFIPLYKLLFAGLDSSILASVVLRYSIGSIISVVMIFTYLRFTNNETDPTWVIVVGTISMFLFCSYLSYLLGVFFLLGFVFLGLGLGIKFYELDFKESIFIGVIFLTSNFVGIAGGLILI